jgi:hypothetical protein
MHIPTICPRFLGTAFACAALATTTAQADLYWTATDAAGAHVMRAGDDGSNPTAIISGASNVRGPNGLEHAAGLLYWPDQQLNAVKQASPDGTGVSTFRLANNPYDVFSTGQRVYWTSQSGNYIDTQLANGTGYQRLLASPQVSAPYAIAVTASHLYWSQVGGAGSIRRSDLNGANIVTIVAVAHVFDLQISGNLLYFADNNAPSAIKRANLDGSGLTTLVTGESGIGLVNGLCVTDDAIYWSAFSDANGGGIRRANLNGGNVVKLYNAPAGTAVRGVVVLPGIRFTDPVAAAGQFSFTLQVEAGKSYRIETSGNLNNWTEITNFISSGSTFSLTNAIPAGPGQLFYRARTP